MMSEAKRDRFPPILPWTVEAHLRENEENPKTESIIRVDSDEDGYWPNLHIFKHLKLKCLVLQNYRSEIDSLTGMSLERLVLPRYEGPTNIIKGMPLRILELDWNEIDSSVIAHMKLEELSVSGVTDVRVFKDMPLRKLHITNLEDSKNMPELPFLEDFFASWTNDIEFLKHSEILCILNLWSFDGDITPITGLPITDLSLPQFHGDLGLIKDMKLKKLNIMFHEGPYDALVKLPLEEIWISAYTGSPDMFNHVKNRHIRDRSIEHKKSE